MGLTLAARDIHVNVERGSDQGDGSRSAPYRNINFAIAKAVPGDVVKILPASVPINYGLSLKDIAGEPGCPIVIDGHFNIIEGAVRIEPKEWQLISPETGLYKFTGKLPTFRTTASYRQRHYMIFDGRTERMNRSSKFEVSKQTFKAPGQLGNYEWTIFNDREFYFKLPPGKPISDADIRIPELMNGVRLTGNCKHVVIRNLIVRHVWNDSYNIHGNCRDIVFEKIASLYSGDDGVSAHGTCQVAINTAYLYGGGTGFGHVGEAEVAHKNIYVGGSVGLDIFLNNTRNSLENIYLDGESKGGISLRNQLVPFRECYFLNRRKEMVSLATRNLVTIPEKVSICNYKLSGSTELQGQFIEKLDPAIIDTAKDKIKAVFRGKL
jgi:hypothetical protein